MALKLASRLSALLLIYVTLINCINAGILDKGTLDVQPMGMVYPITICGGMATFHQFRISDCEGRCQVYVGRLYTAELDFTPSVASPALFIRVQFCIASGFCGIVMDFQIPNSSVQPGVAYTLRYSFVPNDQFLGQTGLNFVNNIYRNITGVGGDEICIGSDIDLLPYQAPTTTTTTIRPPTTTTTTITTTLPLISNISLLQKKLHL